MKITKAILARILWLGRGTATTMGLAVMLALTAGLASTALAAVPGDPFELGKLNSVNKISRLAGSASGALLRVENEGSGSALDLKVEEGEAPMTVDSTTLVNDFNADQLDGQSADDFISEDKIYTVVEGEVGAGGGAEVTVFADCDSGDKLLGGGGGGAFAPDILRLSDPNGQGWRVFAQDNASGSNISSKAICADFPPLR